MSTAFVLSGGGNLGAVQVGMLRALAELGVVPDMIFGTSVGAINAAFLAGRPDSAGVDELARIWCGVRRSDVFPARASDGMRGILGRSNHLVSPRGLRAMLREHLTYERLEDAPVRVAVVATEVTSGVERLIERGDAIDAVAASAAIPGIFPPVRVDGRDLMDGGIANNSPLSHAVAAGADRLYVLPTGYSCALAGAPSSVLGIVLHAVSLLVQQRLIIDVERFQNDCDIRVIPPLCPLDVSPVDFSRTPELIDRSYAFASQWLAESHSDDDQAHLLSIHGHD